MWVAEDVMDMMGKGMYRACYCVGDVMANDGALGSILLVGYVHCCFCSSEESVHWGSVGDNSVGVVVEGDITNSELLCVVAVIVAVATVFANVQKEIEGDCEGITGSLNFRRVGRGS